MDPLDGGDTVTECTLCGLPTPDPPVTDPAAEGSFCCRGCATVASRLDDPAAADPEAARPEATRTGGDGEEAFLGVEGMHCATCEAFIESTATGHEGVLDASASYSADLVRVVYDPDRIDESDLPGTVEGLGYRVRSLEEEPDGADAVGRLIVGGFFGMMVMVWYVLFLYPVYFGVAPDDLLMDVTGPAGWYLLSYVWVMSTVVLGYTGFPILRGAYVSLRAGHPNMDLLVSLAATTAYAYSTVALLAGRTEVYFDVAVVIVLVVTIGGYYEDRIKRRASGHLAALSTERADEARRRTPEGTETVAVDDLDAGDEVVVRSGERIPVDGTVVEGTGTADESLVTGESLPVRKEAGDEVVGGSVLVEGSLVVEVDPGAESTLDRLVRVLWDVQSSHSGAQRLADRIAAVFVPLVVLLAVLAGGWHLLAGATLTGALLTGLAVLVVSCPCALGLATPLAVAAGVRAALGRGIVITDASVFETAPEADVVAFDKTGTLTTGRMRVVDVAGHPETLSRAAAVEQHASHPVAEAIRERAAPPTDASGFEEYPGRGVSADVDDTRVTVGSQELIEERGLDVPTDLARRAEQAAEDGELASFVGWDGRARGLIVAADEPREGWASVVEELAADRRVVVITGDDEAGAERVREHPAVDDVFAGVPPEAKTEVIERLRAEGTVAMVGDGSNDAPAIAAADLGIALGSGTALAADAADAVIVDDDLRSVPAVFSLTAATNRRIRENLGWAFLYNAVAIPLAVTGLLNPLFAALAMGASSLLVVGNSARSLVDGESKRRTERAVAAGAGESGVEA